MTGRNDDCRAQASQHRDTPQVHPYGLWDGGTTPGCHTWRPASLCPSGAGPRRCCGDGQGLGNWGLGSLAGSGRRHSYLPIPPSVRPLLSCSDRAQCRDHALDRSDGPALGA